MSSEFEERQLAELHRLLVEDSQPVAVALIAALKPLRPVPTAVTMIGACRLVGLHCVQRLLDAARSQDERDSIREAMLALDALTSVDALLRGDIEVATRNASRSPNLGLDESVFDIESWGDKST
jgi:hypothetical protein